MLRHPDALSPLADFTRDRFLTVVPEGEISGASRVLIASGKIGHELRAERRRRKDASTAILFLDQLYPFPEADLAAVLASHPAAREIVWVQEEPANMGGWEFVRPLIEARLGDRRPLRYVGRPRSASPSEGSAAWPPSSGYSSPLVSANCVSVMDRA